MQTKSQQRKTRKKHSLDSTRASCEVCKHCGGRIEDQTLSAWYSELSLADSVGSSFDATTTRRSSVASSSVTGTSTIQSYRNALNNEHLALRRKSRVPSNALTAVAHYNEQILQERKIKQDERNEFEGSQRIEGLPVIPKSQNVLPSIPRRVNKDMEMFAIASVERHNKPIGSINGSHLTLNKEYGGIDTINEDGESKVSVSKETMRARQLLNKVPCKPPKTPRTTPVSALETYADFTGDAHHHKYYETDMINIDFVPDRELNEIIKMQKQYLIRQPLKPLPGIVHDNPASPTKSETTLDESTTLTGIDSISVSVTQYELSENGFELNNSNEESLPSNSQPTVGASASLSYNSSNQSTNDSNFHQKNTYHNRSEALSILTSDDNFSVGSSPMKYTFRPKMAKQGYFYYDVPMQSGAESSTRSRKDKKVSNSLKDRYQTSETSIKIREAVRYDDKTSSMDKEKHTHDLRSTINISPAAQINNDNKTENALKSNYLDNHDVTIGQLTNSTRLAVPPVAKSGGLENILMATSSLDAHGLPEIRMIPATPLPQNGHE